MMRVAFAVAVGLLLAGCQSEDESFYNAPKALDKMSPDELCTFYAHYVSNPDLSAQAKTVALDTMRKKGCATK